MKKMISASMALFVMDDPHVGPTVVTLILSSCVAGTALTGVVLLVVVAPAFVVVVVGCAVVAVVDCDAGLWAAVRLSSAASTFVFTAFCWSWDRWLMSDCTLSVWLLPLPSSSTVG